MKKPKFTQEQKDWICYQIGEWYLEFRDKLVNYNNKTHNLGRAKEILKMMICDPDELVELFKDVLLDDNENKLIDTTK